MIAEPKYKYGQQEKVTVRNRNRKPAQEQCGRTVTCQLGLKEHIKQTNNYIINAFMPV